jgi:hypothetical protein
MAELHECPRCGRKAEKGLTHNWFPVHTCGDCGHKYCKECGGGDGTHCPECESTSYFDHDKVYAE